MKALHMQIVMATQARASRVKVKFIYLTLFNSISRVKVPFYHLGSKVF